MFDITTDRDATHCEDALWRELILVAMRTVYKFELIDHDNVVQEAAVSMLAYMQTTQIESDEHAQRAMSIIARRKAISEKQKVQRHARLNEKYLELHPRAKPVTSDQSTDEIWDAVSKLSEPGRRAITLRMKGYSHAEIAELLGIDVGKSMRICHKARVELRDLGFDSREIKKG